MTRVIKWIVAALLLAVLLLIGAAFALHQWVNTADFRARLEKEGGAALGVPLRIGGLAVDVWPLPAVAVNDVRIQTQPPLTLGRVEARPVWSGLLAGRLEVSTLIARDLVLPQPAIAALAAGLQKRDGAAKAKPPQAEAPGKSTLDLLPRRTVLERVTWVDAQGARMTLDAQAEFGGDGLLDSASFKMLQGKFAGARGEIRRTAEGGQESWPLKVDIGGGHVRGPLRLAPGKGGAQVLQGNLVTEGVEVSALTAPSRTLTGKLQAKTTLRAEFREPGQIADALQTQTQFTVNDAVIHGIDLARAVQTVGLSRGGETRLDTLAGQLHTQGRAAQLNNLVASSGALTAAGDVAMAANRSLNGRLTVDLASSKGTLGVPLVVGGTLDSPSVTLTRGALLGAAIGTAVAPGVGTGAGAKLGDRLGEGLKGLFGK
jgi:uncharacterized protein involved in outer membrane biogenesis